jgi:hypothetical protein
MSIVSGLVDTGSERPIMARRLGIKEWLLRHAWGVVIGCSFAFWLGVALLLAVA